MVFHTVSHNSFSTKGYPWINHIQTGLIIRDKCRSCGVRLCQPEGNIRVTLEPTKGTRWPDVLGCGAYPLFIVSSNTIDAFQKAGISNLLMGKVEIFGSLPNKLQSHTPPNYFWIDGNQLGGAELDFDASGFVGVKFCPECKNRTHDIGATYDRQRSGNWPLVIKEGSWNGLQLFTTNLSPTAFFCTATIVEIAQIYKLTNFRFVPITLGDPPEHRGIRYL